MIQKKTHSALMRTDRLISEAIERLSLDLSGLVVYTEAATGHFSVTAPLAARAGAERVIALSRPWKEMSASEVGREMRELSDYMDLSNRITMVTERSLADMAEADIITNLGFVRPLDRNVIAALKPTAVIPFMREAWEQRNDDIDLHACRDHGIAVFATDESSPDVRVFDTCGLLAAKLLFEAGIEISGTHIIIVSSDKFGATIGQCLKKLGARTYLFQTLSDKELLKALPRADALIAADFTAKEMLLGPGGMIGPDVLAKISPALAVIAFAGWVDGNALEQSGLKCVPKEGSLAGRMGRTLAYLGPWPVINLHAAGLKVGAAAAHGARQGLAGRALSEYVCSLSPATEVPI
ncbi:MAG: hypothetical protein M1510_04720 [Nitrospirae bacterium]|nr:hypothetical protein [Nitrospirota bacterium]